MKNKKVLQRIKKPAEIGILSYLADIMGCGTIRVMYPYMLLNHLRIPDVRINTTFLSNYVHEVDFYKSFSFVQFQRSATQFHVDLLKHFKTKVQSNIKVVSVYEIDDLLINIPKWNFASDYYKHNESNVKRLISMTDGVTVSTEPLKKIYSEFNNKISVIPNHLPKFVWGDIFNATDYYNGGKIKILWAGSQNHFANKRMNIDGGDFGKELINFIKKTTDIYDWYLMGAMPKELESVKRKIHFIPWHNIFDYPRTVKLIEPDICIAPLEDNLFNSCKSDIKHLEYVACGAAGIFSDVEPYKNCTVKTKNDEEMISMIEELAGDIDKRSKVWKSDYKRIEQRLWWEENGNLRKYIETYLNMFGKRL